MSARHPGRASRWRAGAFAPSLLLFAIMLAHALLETARDALFLAKLGADRLAWAYLAIAAAALLAVTAVRRWAGVVDPRRVLIAFLVLAAAGTAVLAAAISIAPWVVFVLYVWTGLIATVALAPHGEEMMFPLNTATISITLIGHLIFGFFLGLAFLKAPHGGAHRDWPWTPILETRIVRRFTPAAWRRSHRSAR